MSTLSKTILIISTLLNLSSVQGLAEEYSLRFFGNGVADIDRVKIRIDDPQNNLPGPPADVGSTDFTLEFRMKGSEWENQAPAVSCGSGNVNWIYGNILFDRDRYNQDRKWGLSIAGGLLVFGMSGDGTGDYTICGTSSVLDGQWHHVAVQRRRSDGWLWLFVDGNLESSADGPDGDVSYPDNGIPGNYCGGPCINSDPFLVIAAEKHDAGPEYPSFSGWIDEIRISTVLRYSSNFSPSATPYAPDSSTVALYHCNEGGGVILYDVSGASGGPSNGILRFGGNPAGPVWSTDSPFENLPQMVSDLVILLQEEHQIRLIWSAISGFVQYRIYRSPVGDFVPPMEGTLLISTSDTTFTDSIFSGNAFYRVIALREP